MRLDDIECEIYRTGGRVRLRRCEPSRWVTESQTAMLTSRKQKWVASDGREACCRCNLLLFLAVFKAVSYGLSRSCIDGDWNENRPYHVEAIKRASPAATASCCTTLHRQKAPGQRFEVSKTTKDAVRDLISALSVP